jgi:O-antigen ligase/polysaccharide polymerase Wzy-like membrane protein
MHAGTAQVAALAGGFGAAGVLLARERAVLLGGLLLLGLAEAGLELASADLGSVDGLVSPAGAVLSVAGVALLWAAAAVLVRRPALVPLAVLAAAPFRLPLQFDASGGFPVSVATDGRLGRLLPLYFVLAAALLALAYRVARGERPRNLARPIALPAAGFLAFACLSLLWADPVKPGADLLAFFLLPFAGLLAVVGRSPFPASLPRQLGRLAVGLAALFAVVGLYQAATHHLFFFAPNLETSNANTDFFRVTSLFVDPSLYGRHVVLGLSVLLVALALGRIGSLAGAALVALLWAGLLFSYSQSSMAALVVVTLALVALTGGRVTRRAVASAAAVLAVAAVALIAVAAVDDSLRRETSDRSDRVAKTAKVIAHHPLAGVGIGDQPRASRRLAHSDKPTADFVSHTTPLTVAAELGAVGLALYLLLLAGGVRTIDLVRRDDAALGLTLGAALLALFVHSLFYSGFFEDPLTWLVLGLACAFVAEREATATAADRARERARHRPAAAAAA